MIAAAFVAVNTVIYAALAVAKVLPKVHPPDWRRGRRSEPRGIHPHGQSEPEPGAAEAEPGLATIGAGLREP